MNYMKFKRELYAQILRQKETAGKQVRLLEREGICADAESVKFVKTCNAALYGRSEVFVREDMLCILWGEWETMRMLYWRTGNLYDRFLREGWQGVLPEIISKLQFYGEQKDLAAPYEENGKILERLFLRPVNYPCNAEDLKSVIYWRFGDIALVLHTLLYESGEDHMSMPCKRDMLRGEGLPDEVILTNALLQTCAMMPPRLYHSGDIGRYFGEKTGILMPVEEGEGAAVCCEDAEEGARGYRLTNAKRFEGALALFYPGVREQLAGMMRGDYYVGFVSIHEAVIHPVRHKSLPDMKAAIRRINALSDEREVLTTRVYRYVCNRNRLMEV